MTITKVDRAIIAVEPRGAPGVAGPPGGNYYASRTSAAGLIIPSATSAIIVGGDAIEGDGGGNLYKKVGAGPANDIRFQSLDGAWWQRQLWAQPRRARQIPLDLAGVYPGESVTNNHIAWNAVMAAHTQGDTYIWPAWDTGSDDYKSITFFDVEPNPLPSNSTLRGPGRDASSSGVCRRYAVSDFRQPFIRLGLQSSTAENFTVYIDTAFTSGAPWGIIGGASDFIIHPTVDNVHATYFGGGSGRWACGAVLDASAGVYASGGRGARDARISRCKSWGFTYAGAYFSGVLAGDIEMTLTGEAAAAGLTLTGNANNPSYSNLIRMNQSGDLIVDHAFNNVIVGSFPDVTFGNVATSNKVIIPTILTSAATESGTAAQNNVWAGYNMYSDTAFPFTTLGM